MKIKIIYFNEHAARLGSILRAAKKGFEVLPATCLLEFAQALKLDTTRALVLDLLDMHQEERLRSADYIARIISENKRNLLATGRHLYVIVFGLAALPSLQSLPEVTVHCFESEPDTVQLSNMLDMVKEPPQPSGISASKSSQEIYIIGQSKRMRNVIQLLETYARRSEPVLILGETGTGKELAARALHNWGARCKEPFIALNCATIPELLFESEMFGTERGAFTDSANRRGAIEEAENGTLFLDEISSLSLSNQPRLLRVLETGEYRRLGNPQLKTAHFRLISASCDNPIDLAERNQFRKDLLFRIACLIIELPPLRERREDILLLARYFCSQFSNASSWIEDSAADKLFHYDWPGNIRELRSVISRACVHRAGKQIRPEDIQFLSRPGRFRQPELFSEKDMGFA